MPGGREEEARIYEVLFSTGPDVVSEAAAALAVGAKTVGGRETPAGGEGAGHPSEAAAADESPSEAHALIGGTGSHVLLVDPGPMVVNANSWSWRGSGNVAMKEPAKRRR